MEPDTHEMPTRSMITIRPFREGDAAAVGRLIADTYAQFNLAFLPPQDRGPFLGPFQHAASPDETHLEAIRRVVRSPLLYVAEEGGEIVGVLRGRKERLASLFVRGDRHRQGIGRMLVQRFEDAVAKQGSIVVRVAATLYAVPFYLAMGYKRSTGVRSGWSFEGRGLPVQPMKKVLGEAKMASSISHIALVVPDLRAAESYYRSVFDMELVGRETARADGLWYTLPFDRDWYDAEAAGIELDMVALRKGEFVLALFKGGAPRGQVYVIGLRMSLDEIARVRAGLAELAQGGEGAADSLEFVDPYQITWQISVPGSAFRTAGDFAGRWLEV